MHSEYIEQRNGGFYVAGTRVSLDSIVYSFKSGDSPETIRQMPIFAKGKKRSSVRSRI